MTQLIFDIETIIDVERLLRVEKPTPLPGEKLDEMIARETTRICELDPQVKSGAKTCFMPVRYHAPVAIAMLLVDDDMRYVKHVVVAHQKADPQFPKVLVPDFKANTHAFWTAYHWAKKTFGGCRLVTFGGFNFDLPCLEITALEYGIQISDWYVPDAPSYNDPRSAYGRKFHLDLSQYLSNNKGGTLNFYSRLLGLPGKMESDGSKVADMLKANGGHEAVKAYCMTDVINTYGVLFGYGHSACDLPQRPRGNPIFEDTMAKCIAGLGKEAQAYSDQYALSLTQVPF